MKKVIIAATLISVAFFVTACSNGSNTPTPTVTVTHEAGQSAPSVDDGQSINPRQDYILSIHSVGNSILNSATDSQLLEMGDSVCQARSAGYTVNDILQYLAQQMVTEGMTSDVETEAVGTIVAAAVTFLCPQFGTA